MANLVIVGTSRYSINVSDFDLLYRNSRHKISLFYHESIKKKPWFPTGKPCPGNRSGISTDLRKIHKQSWSSIKDLTKLIQKTRPDYVCLGNGNDDAGKQITKVLPDQKFLYGEYGVFFWNKNFYIDRLGVGAKSEIAKTRNLSESYNTDQWTEDINLLKKELQSGESVPFKAFIYVPLQVDSPCSDGKPDFKYQFSSFPNNKKFLAFLQKIIPSEMTILVKNHPSNKIPTPVPSGMVDISNLKLSKYELYSKMSAMCVINSTAAIEACLFNSPIITFGKCLFSNKEITHEHVKTQDDFKRALEINIDEGLRKRFINLIFERQVDRTKCGNSDYINEHYWTRTI